MPTATQTAQIAQTKNALIAAKDIIRRAVEAAGPTWGRLSADGRLVETRIGMLGQALLMLGAIPLPPPKREVDLAAVEQVIRDLNAAGLDSLVVADRAGPERFVELGRSVLAMQRTQRAQGRELPIEALLAELDRPQTQMPEQHVISHDVRAMRPALEYSLAPSFRGSPTPQKAPRPAKSPIDRSGQRAEQAKARANKSRRKARKGWA